MEDSAGKEGGDGAGNHEVKNGFIYINVANLSIFSLFQVKVEQGRRQEEEEEAERGETHAIRVPG